MADHNGKTPWTHYDKCGAKNGTYRCQLPRGHSGKHEGKTQGIVGGKPVRWGG